MARRAARRYTSSRARDVARRKGPGDDAVAGAGERSTMITVKRLARILTALLALPEGYPAEGVYRPGRRERLEMWGQEEPKPVRVPYWLQR